jgi:hypothetical protein
MGRRLRHKRFGVGRYGRALADFYRRAQGVAGRVRHGGHGRARGISRGHEEDHRNHVDHAT